MTLELKSEKYEQFVEEEYAKRMWAISNEAAKAVLIAINVDRQNV